MADVAVIIFPLLAQCVTGPEAITLSVTEDEVCNHIQVAVYIMYVCSVTAVNKIYNVNCNIIRKCKHLLFGVSYLHSWYSLWMK